MPIVYMAKNCVNNKCYIGQTKRPLEERIKSHKKEGRYFHKALKKYGLENFIWEILCECEDQEELDEMEFHYIKQYHTHSSEYGYNLTFGGEGVWGKRGSWDVCYGKEKSDKMKKRRSLLSKGSNNPNFGGKHSNGEKARDFIRGKTFDQIYGIEESLCKRTKMKETTKKQWEHGLYDNRDMTNILKGIEKRTKIYKITDTNNKEYIGKGLMPLCKKYNFEYKSIKKILEGKSLAKYNKVYGYKVEELHG